MGVMLPCNVVVQEHENGEVEVSALGPIEISKKVPLQRNFPSPPPSLETSCELLLMTSIAIIVKDTVKFTYGVGKLYDNTGARLTVL